MRRSWARARSLLRILCGFCICSSVATCAGAEPIFDGERALRDVIAQVEIGPRPAGSAGSAAARRLIRERLREAGWDAVEQPFLAEPPGRPPVSMTNLIATYANGAAESSEDRARRRILLAAHYDTKQIPGVRFLGANDGGSGVAVLLELARTLPKVVDPSTIQLVFFDGEEAFGPSITPADGLYGSRELALRMTQEGSLDRVAALVVFDMVGDRDLGLAIDTRSSPELRQLAMEAGGDSVEWTHEMAVIDDHSPFLERGLEDALVLIDFQYGARRSPGPLWHTAQDDADAVSASSLQKVGMLGIELVRRLQARVSGE